MPKPDATRRLVARYTALLERDFRIRHGRGRFCRRAGRDADASDALLQCGLRPLGQRAVAGPPDLRGAQAAGRNRIPVGRIADELGFNSAAYFTRAFQHLTGKSPIAFRRAP